MSELIQNKVSESGLVTLNLEEYFPKEEVVSFDLKPYLFMELLLKEKDFRQSLQDIEWAKFKDKIVAVNCSSDAIIPVWAYMLVAAALQPHAAAIVFGDSDKATQEVLLKNVFKIDLESFKDQRVVIKGCGELPISESVYMHVTFMLRPVVKSIMYGEPCSTVPVYKKRP